MNVELTDAPWQVSYVHALRTLRNHLESIYHLVRHYTTAGDHRAERLNSTRVSCSDDRSSSRALMMMMMFC